MTERDRAAMAVFPVRDICQRQCGSRPARREDPVGHVESSAFGVGHTEAERRSLTFADEIDIVNREIRDRLDAVELVATTRPDAARQLRGEAALLQTLLDG
jgi:hypothetical protein